jgi:hypothetical protein
MLTPKKAILKRPRGILDAIYWRLHTSFLRNRRDEAKKFLGMLNTYTEREILSELHPIHFERFKTIQRRIEQNLFGRLYGEGYQTPIFEQNFAPVQKSGPELEFCKELVRQKTKLLYILQASPTALVGREEEMREFGRCDILARDNRIIRAVEVKMGEAPSSVVSQIDKYVLALELNMCLGLYDIVVGTVIAEKFPPYVAAELSRIGINMITHSGTVDSLTKIDYI